MLDEETIAEELETLEEEISTEELEILEEDATFEELDILDEETASEELEEAIAAEDEEWITELDDEGPETEELDRVAPDEEELTTVILDEDSVVAQLPPVSFAAVDESLPQAVNDRAHSRAAPDTIFLENSKFTADLIILYNLL